MRSAPHGVAALAMALLLLPRSALGQVIGPVFIVQSGDCRVAGRCLTSPQWPLYYSNDGSCVVTLPEPVQLYTLFFSTQRAHDGLTVGEAAFSGHTGPALASANGTIRWWSDSVVEGAGFVICAGLPCGAGTCNISDVGAAMCSIPSCSEDKCGAPVPLPDGGLCSDGAATTARGTCASGSCATEPCPVLRPLMAGHCPSSCQSLPRCSAQGASVSNTNGTVCRGDGWCATVAEHHAGKVSGSCCSDGMAYSREVLCGGANCSSTQCATVGCDATTNTCVYSPVAAGVKCDDGDTATGKDVCDGAGGCKGSPCRQYRLAIDSECPSNCDLVPPCGELGNVCHGDGNCGAFARTSEAQCCGRSPVYVAVEPCGDTMCSSSLCQTASCGTGHQCASSPAVPPGTPCDDGNAGTFDDVCTQGVCSGRPWTTNTTELFQVTSGDCNVTQEGRCISTSNYPIYAYTKEGCAFALAAPALLQVISFSTSAPLVVNGHRYTDRSGPNGVVARGRIEWVTPFSGRDIGRYGPYGVWLVCAAVLCGGKMCPDGDSTCSFPACGPGGTCTTRNVADGTTCFDEANNVLAQCVQGKCLGQCPVYRPALPSECPSDCAALPGCSAAGPRICRPSYFCGGELMVNCCGSSFGWSYAVGIKVVFCGGHLCSAGQCHDAVCHESGTGCATMILPDGTPCDDSNIGTVDDTCRAGSCNGTALNMPPGNFTVISGPCEVTDGGACLQSPAYPGEWLENDSKDPEECEVKVSANATPLKVISFTTSHDLYINDRSYYGRAGPEGVIPNGTIRWRVEHIYPGSGWRICQTLWCSGVQCGSVSGQCLVAASACGADGACATVRAQEGTPCSDGDAATTQDSCNADGTCAGQPCPLLRAALAHECPSDCRALPPCSVANRSMCRGEVSCGADDGWATYYSWSPYSDPNCCHYSVRVSIRVVECGGMTCSGGRCHEARCADDGGCSTAHFPQGTPCDDGDPRTMDDKCSADGLCAGIRCPMFRPADRNKGECPVDCSNLPPCRNSTGPLCKGDGWCGTVTWGNNCCGGTGKVYLKQLDCSPAGSTSTLICNATQCTIPQCAGAECGSQALTDGTPCDDGDVGTAGDSCGAGKCVGSPRSAPPGRFRTTGPCVVEEQGRCVTSPNYTQPHGRTRCVIKVENATPLVFKYFHSGRLEMDGTRYLGDMGLQGVLPHNDTLVWESGSDTARIRICQSLYCGGKQCEEECFSTGSCGPDGGCPTKGLPEGTPCDDGHADTTNDTCRVVGGRTHCAGSVPGHSWHTRTNVFCSEFANDTAPKLHSLVECQRVCDQISDCIACSYKCLQGGRGRGLFAAVNACTEQVSVCGSYVRYKVAAPLQAGACEPVTIGTGHPHHWPRTITTDVAYAECDSPVTIDNRLNTDRPDELHVFTVAVNGTQITVTRLDRIGGEGDTDITWSMRLRICCRRQVSVADAFEFTEGHYCGDAANANHLPESSWEGFTLNSCAAACSGSADCTRFAVTSASRIGSVLCVQYGKGDNCVLTASEDWGLYIKKPKCQDDNGFRDQFGHPCVWWLMKDCSRAAGDWGYSLARQAEIIERCPLSCGWCQGCPWATPTDKADVIECSDGSLSRPGDWGFCALRGKRRRCPANLPHMCAAVDCAGYGDHCCEADCAMKGGLRLCPGATSTPISGNTSMPAVVATAPPEVTSSAPPEVTSNAPSEVTSSAPPTAGEKFKLCGDPVGEGDVCAGSSLNVGGVCTCANGTICCRDTVCIGLFGRACIPHLDECDALPCGSGQICNDSLPYFGATEGNSTFRCFCESDLRRVASGGPATCGGPCLGWRQTGACSPDGPREPGMDRGCESPIDSGSSGFCECESSGRGAWRALLECGHNVTTCAELCNPCHGVACPAPPCHSAVVCDEMTGRCPLHPVLADGTECADPAGTASCVAGVCLSAWSTPAPGWGRTGVAAPPSSGPSWGDAWMLAIGVGAVLAVLTALGVCYWLRQTRAGRLVVLRSAGMPPLEPPARSADTRATDAHTMSGVSTSPPQSREMAVRAEADISHELGAQPQCAARTSSASPLGPQSGDV